MSDLRNRLIKLAYERPEMREDLVPLLVKAAASSISFKAEGMNDVLFRILEAMLGVIEGRAKKDPNVDKVDVKGRMNMGYAMTVYRKDESHAIMIHLVQFSGKVQDPQLRVDLRVDSEDGSLQEETSFSVSLRMGFDTAAHVVYNEAVNFYDKMTRR